MATLAPWLRVLVAGEEYHNAPTKTERQTVSLDLEFRDQESGRLKLRCWDAIKPVAFEVYNSWQNPRLNGEIAVEAWLGWSESTIYKVFSGIVLADECSYMPSYSSVVAVHRAFRLRKDAKVRTYTGLTVGDFLVMKAKEHGLNLIIDSSVAGDEALNQPCQWQAQIGEANWRVMKRYIRELGYITMTLRANDILLRKDKADLPVVEVTWPDDPDLLSMLVRCQQPDEQRARKRKGLLHETRPGRRAKHTHGTDAVGARHIAKNPAAIAKKKGPPHKHPFSRFSVRGRQARIKREGDELTLSLRLKPQMKNLEQVRMSGFGPRINGLWDTASVVHRVRGGDAVTDVQAWRESK